MKPFSFRRNRANHAPEKVEDTVARSDEPKTTFVAVMLIDHRGRREPRRVWPRGEFAIAFSLGDEAGPEVRLLPHGKVDATGANWIFGWEPLDPIDWQPDFAETSHEKIRRLEAEIGELRRDLKIERMRFGIVAAAVHEAEGQRR